MAPRVRTKNASKGTLWTVSTCRAKHAWNMRRSQRFREIKAAKQTTKPKLCQETFSAGAFLSERP